MKHPLRFAKGGGEPTAVMTAYRHGRPHLPLTRLNICLTESCNLRCAYCWHQKAHLDALPFSAVSKLIDEACREGPPAELRLTGGEPPLWPGFEELIAHARAAGIPSIQVCTSGYCLRKLDYFERLRALGITSFNVSVETFDPATFEQLRGYAFWEFNRALRNCVVMKRAYPQLQISLGSVISKRITSRDLFAVSTFCFMHGFYHYLQTFAPIGEPAIDSAYALSDRERYDFCKKLWWVRGRIGRVLKRKTNPLTVAQGGIPCLKGVTTATVFSDGTLRFCWHTPAVGNILHDSFDTIWHSEEASALRSFVRERKCLCTFDCDIIDGLWLYEMYAA